MLFITQLILHRCNRFFVRGIETIEINPSMKTQIVLGTNGSGKSSLLKVGFTVTPPTKDDFKEGGGGYKILKCVGNGHEYELRSMFTEKTPKHWFIVDGENLNPGFTLGIQKELVREHFGMTQDLHDVLTGSLLFTSMSTVQRRDWITRLATADFDYVIKLHNRIKKAHHAAGVIIRHQSGRLVDETSKKKDDADIADLNRQSREMRDMLAKLFTELDSELANTSYDSIRDGISYLNGRIETTVDQMLKIDLRAPEGVSETDLKAIGELVEELRGERRALYAALSEVSEQHQLVDKQMHEISVLDDVDPVELQKEIDTRQDEIEKSRASFKTNLDLELLCKSATQVSTVTEVMGALHEVMPGLAETYSRDIVYQRQQELQGLQDTFAQGTSRISEVEYRLNHIANCHDIGCPNCGHTFKEGVNANEEADLRETLRKGMLFKDNMEVKMKGARDFLNDARSATDKLFELETLRNRNPHLAGLWNLFGANGGAHRGRELLPLCQDFISDSHKAIRIGQLTFELLPLIEKMNQINSMDKSGSLRELHGKLSSRIAAIQTDINGVQARSTVVEKYYRERQEFENLQSELMTMKEHQESQFTRMVDFTFNEEVSALVKKYQVSLAMLENTLTEAEMQVGIVNDITKSLEQAREEEISLSMLEKMLSPKGGLIAEQILVFINTFIGSINEVISKVWGYNLALDNCNIEDGELNYKFPMFIHNTANMVPDIECGSDSQKDIVNQAFRLVVYKFMELHGHPLYLDELGRTFDEVHKHNLTFAIKDLIEDEMYSQIFFITHSFESQNGFPNSQIAVIDDSHVSLKRVYNEHVKIQLS